jgi:hypothetical protein
MPEYLLGRYTETAQLLVRKENPLIISNIIKKGKMDVFGAKKLNDEKE